MAPAMSSAMSTSVDLVALTIENCRFFHPPGAVFTVITPKDPRETKEPKGYGAFVLRTVNGYRNVVLGVSGSTPEQALHELHSQSADAARRYISVNGFALPADSAIDVPMTFKYPSSKPRSDRGPAVSDLSSMPVDVLDNSLSSSGCESLSDDETLSIVSGVSSVSGTGEKRAKHKNRKEHKRKDSSAASNATRRSRSRSRSQSSSRSVSRSRSRSRSSSTSSDFDTTPRAPRPKQPPTLVPPPPKALNRAPMPAGFRMPGAPLPRPSVPSPPARPMMAPQNTGFHDVLIRIHWVGRGYAQVLKRLVPKQATLHATALGYVRRNPGAFGGAQPSDHLALKMPLGSPGSLCLFASLRSVTVAGEQIDLSAYQGENLGALIQEAHDARASLPKFEIDIQSAPSPPPLPHGAKGLARPKSTGPVIGEC